MSYHTLWMNPAPVDHGSLVELLRARGHRLTQVPTCAEALALLAREPFDMVLVALSGLGDCPDFCQQARERAKDTWPLVLVVVEGNEAAELTAALGSGADDYLVRQDIDGMLALRMSVAEHRVEDGRQRREMLEALARSESRFRELLAAAPDAMACIDRSGRIVLLNEQLARLSGYAIDELLGQPVEILVPRQYSETHVAQRDAFFCRPSARPMGTALHLTLLHKSGVEIPVDICIGYHRSGDELLAIAAVRDITERRRAEEELRLAKESAERAYRLVRRDLQAAARIQRAVLPQERIAGESIELAWDFSPCEDLGGDGLNAFWLDGQHLGFYVLDVSGHGVAAALLSVTMARLLSPAFEQSTLLRQSEQGGTQRLTSPAAVAGHLNHWLLTNPSDDHFVTLFYGIVDVARKRLCYVSAGHPPALLAPRQGSCRLLTAAGFPLGVADAAVFDEHEVALAAGDRVLVYSDGLVEAVNPDDEMYGIDRLCARAEQDRAAPLADWVANSSAAVLEWSGRHLADDMSCLGIEVR